jgi:hypothetical protein
MRRGGLLAVVLVLALAVAAPATAGTKYGDLTFPQVESANPASWDYWWGMADVTAESGNRYLVEMAFTSLEGSMASSYIVYPLQGPLRGRTVASMMGPREWGHPEQPAGRYLNTMTFATPGVDQRMRLDTYDTKGGLHRLNRWERTRLDKLAYRLTLDEAEAGVHPDNEQVHLKLDLRARMRNTPLLDGGTGRWFYGVPEDFNYPSRAYQYMQGARRLTGTLEMSGPRGFKETIDPERSLLLMTRESNPPEAIPVGLGLAATTQVHPGYFQSYNLQWPWELVYAELGNGAELMFDLQAYHDTTRGTLRPVNPQQPVYRVLATVRLPSGESVAINGGLHAEHLAYRRLDEGIASAAGTSLSSPWVEGWKLRVSYPGGTLKAGNGKQVHVPAFDLGLVPPFEEHEPLRDDQNRRLTQRVPFDVDGIYDGCPVHGFAWSEMLANWYGWEDRDPWWTGGAPPKVPRRCLKNPPPPPSGQPGELTPPDEPFTVPEVGSEGCSAGLGGVPTCEYDAKHYGGLGGASTLPGDWTATITSPTRAGPLRIPSHGGFEAFACKTIRPGDHVVLTAANGAAVYAGDPAICF